MEPIILFLYFKYFSLGCNIGYGYLHRIPKRQFPSSKGQPHTNLVTPSAPPPSPPKDGFSEVFISHFYKKINHFQSGTETFLSPIIYII